jgi:uncharacterized protein YfaP (DUF2135 family)
MLRLISVISTIASVLVAFSGSARADIYGAVLPSSRAVQIGHVVTAFATILNANASTATNCGLSAPGNFQGTFSFQTTNPTTNQLTGSVNTRVSIAAGAAQTYVFAMTPSSTFAQTDFQLGMTCTGFSVVPITGVNTFLLTSSASPTADIVTVAATVSNDGIARTPGTTATGVFSVAAINIGVAATVTVSVDTGNTAVNASFGLCRTNAQGQCTTPSTPAASVQTTLANNETGFFSVFLTSQGTVIPLDPARFRAFVRYKVAGNSVGATSVAIQTQTMLADGGGNLQLGNVGINVPGGTIIAGTNFAASPVQAPAPAPAGFQSLNSAYNITLTNTAGVSDNGLNAPVSVKIPYSGLGVADPSKLSVLHYDSATGQYSPTTIIEINTSSQTITFDSRQFSSFLLTTLNANILGASTASNSANIDFAPASHGFAIQNSGDMYITHGGNCMGMSNFVTWFFRNRPTQTLFSRYSSARPNPAVRSSIQDLVATLAHVNASKYWVGIRNYQLPQWQHNNPAIIQFALRAHLAAFRQPVVLSIGSSPGSYEHAIVAYGYNANNILVYDPNYPGQSRTIPYTASGFGTYDGTYKAFAAIYSTSFSAPYAFDSLAQQADGGFTGATNLNVTSPTQGQVVNSRKVTLSGTLAAPVNNQSAVFLWQNGTPDFLNIGTSPFNRDIAVASGENNLVLIAGVEAYSGLVQNALVNAVAKIVKFTGPASAKFRSTLEWVQDNTDVDQYVTEPTGATAWYSGHTTPAGLTLDVDNTSGFGPENTTVEATSTPIPGIYKVRLHYYSDHGTAQPTSGTVTITVNERGGANQVGPVPRNWSITLSNSSNATPGKAGPDWIDIADVDINNKTITLR